MAAGLAVDDVVEITSIGRLHGETTLNVFHFVITAPPVGVPSPTDQLIAIGNWFYQDVQTTLSGFLSNEFTFTGTRVQKVKPERYRPLLQLRTLSGVISSPSIPSSSAVVVKRFDALSGPTHQGRFFLPGIPRTAVALSLYNNATAADLYGELVAPLTDVITLPNGTEMLHVLYNPIQGFNDRFINGIEVTLPIRSQRRRQVGRGI